MEWSNEKVVHLIDLYRGHTTLWDTKSPDYKDRNKRNDALCEIAIVLGIEKEEVERKLKNLYCHYSRELKKEKEKKSGSGTEENYRSKWFAFKSLEFLRNKNRPRRILDTQDPKGNEEFEIQHTITPKVENEDENNIIPEGSKRKRIMSLKHITTKKSKVENPKVNKAHTIMKNNYPQREAKDEFSLFGEQIAIKVRKLKTHHAKAVVQHVINTTLFEAELGKYDHPPKSPNYPLYLQFPPPQVQYSNFQNLCFPAANQFQVPQESSPAVSPSSSYTSEAMFSPTIQSDNELDLYNA